MPKGSPPPSPSGSGPPSRPGGRGGFPGAVEFEFPCGDAVEGGVELKPANAFENADGVATGATPPKADGMRGDHDCGAAQVSPDGIGSLVPTLVPQLARRSGALEAGPGAAEAGG